MLVFSKINDLSAHLEKIKKSDKEVGFVPTMGALHDGHISLLKKAKAENQIVVVSIFVNPTQFNNPDDLKNYPRTPLEDQNILRENNADIIFSPQVDEIYTHDFKEKEILKLDSLADVMEGAHRPGHFAGVVQIVSKLFEIVKPTRAYFGEKDFQQLAIIKFMTEKMKFPIEIIACQTVREKSGLAMSSRNLKLSKEGLENAVNIYKTLNFVKDNHDKYQPEEIKKKAVAMIEASGKLKVEYVELADEISLQPIKNWNQYKHIRCFAAVYCENVRLIDNIRIV